jgi:hypothetical protein
MITKKQVLDMFEYSELTPQTFKIRGVKVEIWHDTDTGNPYDNCDDMAPAIWFSPDRSSGVYREYGGCDLGRVIWYMKPRFVSQNWRKIAAILDLSETEADSVCRALQADYGGGLPEIRQEYFADCLANMRFSSYSGAIDYLEALRALYVLRGFPADTFQTTGYCQGNVMRGLIVRIPKWVEKVGCGARDPEAIKKDMELEAQAFGAWAWGNCYGYTVGDESCGGFYGFDSEYMAECIADELNGIIDRRHEKQAAKIQDSRPDLAPMWEGTSA